MKGKAAHRVVTDPVCRMEFPVHAAAATLKFNDRTYYFCHAACLRLFQADPLTYIRDADVEVPPASKQAAS